MITYTKTYKSDKTQPITSALRQLETPDCIVPIVVKKSFNRISLTIFLRNANANALDKEWMDNILRTIAKSANTDYSKISIIVETGFWSRTFINSSKFLTELGLPHSCTNNHKYRINVDWDDLLAHYHKDQ